MIFWRWCLFSVLVINSFWVASARADSFDDYAKFIEQKFYLLDKQNFSKISCRIEAPLVKDLVAKIKQQFDASNVPVKIKENLSDFSLTYTKGVGLHFNKPVFDVEVLSPGAIKDKESFKKDVEQMKVRFTREIDGIANVLETVFNEWERPDRTKVTIKLFTEKGGIGRVDLEQAGLTEEIIYEGRTRVTEFLGPKMIGEADDEFVDEGGFLLFDNSKGHVREMGAGVLAKDAFSIKYQKVQGITFPSEIVQRLELEVGGVESETQFDIFLRNCSVE